MMCAGRTEDLLLDCTDANTQDTHRRTPTGGLTAEQTLCGVHPAARFPAQKERRIRQEKNPGAVIC